MDTERFVRLLRWLAQQEVEYEPEAGDPAKMPRVTAAEVAEHLGLDQADQIGLGRLYALLQLDHRGLGGSGSGDDGWYVWIDPDICRFRDVQTVEDCVWAREAWIAESRAALLDFRDQVDDALHRQISVKADVLMFDDMPASVCANRLLQDCAGRL